MPSPILVGDHVPPGHRSALTVLCKDAFLFQPGSHFGDLQGQCVAGTVKTGCQTINNINKVDRGPLSRASQALFRFTGAAVESIRKGK
jgi:hypothetical protein